MTILVHSSLDMEYLRYAFRTIVHVLNRLPIKSLANQIPYTPLYRKVHYFNFLKTFGCLCFFFVLDLITLINCNRTLYLPFYWGMHPNNKITCVYILLLVESILEDLEGLMNKYFLHILLLILIMVQLTHFMFPMTITHYTLLTPNFHFLSHKLHHLSSTSYSVVPIPNTSHCSSDAHFVHSQFVLPHVFTNISLFDHDQSLPSLPSFT